MTTSAATPDSQPLPLLTYGRVGFDGRRLTAVEGGTVMVAVDRADVRRIAVRYGQTAAHPVREGVLGFVLAIAAGYLPVAHAIYWVRHGGVFFEHEALLTPFAVIGLWLIWSALRRGWYLRVETPTTAKKFAFGPKIDVDQINAFLDHLAAAYGCPVDQRAAQ